MHAVCARNGLQQKTSWLYTVEHTVGTVHFVATSAARHLPRRPLWEFTGVYTLERSPITVKCVGKNFQLLIQCVDISVHTRPPPSLQLWRACPQWTIMQINQQQKRIKKNTWQLTIIFGCCRTLYLENIYLYIYIYIYIYICATSNK